MRLSFLTSIGALVLALTSSLHAADLTAIDEQETKVCGIGAINWKEDITFCKKGDVLVVHEYDTLSARVAARVCDLNTINFLGKDWGSRRAVAVCQYRGEVLEERYFRK